MEQIEVGVDFKHEDLTDVQYHRDITHTLADVFQRVYDQLHPDVIVGG